MCGGAEAEAASACGVQKTTTGVIYPFSGALTGTLSLPIRLN